MRPPYAHLRPPSIRHTDARRKDVKCTRRNHQRPLHVLRETPTVLRPPRNSTPPESLGVFTWRSTDRTLFQIKESLLSLADAIADKTNARRGHTHHTGFRPRNTREPPAADTEEYKTIKSSPNRTRRPVPYLEKECACSSHRQPPSHSRFGSFGAGLNAVRMLSLVPHSDFSKINP